jgi:hypothetical protein
MEGRLCFMDKFISKAKDVLEDVTAKAKDTAGI